MRLSARPSKPPLHKTLPLVPLPLEWGGAKAHRVEKRPFSFAINMYARLNQPSTSVSSVRRSEMTRERR
jgi:hypothetical protein